MWLLKAVSSRVEARADEEFLLATCPGCVERRDGRGWRCWPSQSPGELILVGIILDEEVPGLTFVVTRNDRAGCLYELNGEKSRRVIGQNCLPINPFGALHSINLSDEWRRFASQDMKASSHKLNEAVDGGEKKM